MLRRAIHFSKRCKSLNARSKPPKAGGLEASKIAEEAMQAFQKQYYDPSNVSLDLSKSNISLFQHITDSSKLRQQRRIGVPSKVWLDRRKSQINQLAKTIHELIVKGKISLNKNLSPLEVGDLVLLDLNSTSLHVVVEKPHDLSTSSYTLINHEGEIMYVALSQIKLRIPQVLNPEMLASLQVIQREVKNRDIAPIGVPDSKFSRSPAALPRDSPELSDEQSEENSLKASTSSSAGSSTTGEAFIIAQATSQLLTNTDVLTYIVPSSARLLFSQALLKTNNNISKKIYKYNEILDEIHSVLQYEENNRLITSDGSIPIFELFDFVNSFKAEKGSLEDTDTVKRYREINSRIRQLSSQRNSSMGKSFPNETKNGFGDFLYPVTSYLAFILALCENPRKWRLNLHGHFKVPLSVEIFPEQKSINTTRTLAHLKNNGIQKFASFYTNFMKSRKKTKLPRFYHSTIQLLKDFVVSNITEDRELESVIGNLLRRIDTSLDEAGLRKDKQIPFSFEYSKCRAYEVILSLEGDTWVNPIEWSNTLRLADKGTSPESDLNHDFYNFIDTAFKSKEELVSAITSKLPDSGQTALELQDFEDKLVPSVDSFQEVISKDFHQNDPMSRVRKDFGQTPVYCIDSETAHEIDDGISIMLQGDEYVLTVHVADPTSYLKQDSTLAKIAFSKGTTVYLPESPSFMLPQLISKICGLDAKGPNRTFAVQFNIPKAEIDNIDEVQQLSPKMMRSIASTAKVEFFTIHDAPRGFTYEKVNRILNDKENIEKFRSNKLLQGSHEWNLFKLEQVSRYLSRLRSEFTSSMLYPTTSYKLSVEYVDSKDIKGNYFKKTSEGAQLTVPPEYGFEKTPVISLKEDVNQSEGSKSQALVSNFMIMGNYACSEFAYQNNVPIILRTQEVKFSKELKREIEKVMRKQRQEGIISVEQLSAIRSSLPSANYEVNEKGHHSLGLNRYLHFTSPLRRYIDMVNHWILGEFISRGETLNKENLAYIANHLHITNFFGKKAQTFSTKFWKGLFLKHYFELQRRGELKDKIQFEFFLLSDAKHGDVACQTKYFEELKTTIVASEFVKKQFNEGVYEVGKAIKPDFEVKKIDFIEMELVIELTCK